MQKRHLERDANKQKNKVKANNLDFRPRVNPRIVYLWWGRAWLPMLLCNFPKSFVWPKKQKQFHRKSSKCVWAWGACVPPPPSPFCVQTTTCPTYLLVIRMQEGLVPLENHLSVQTVLLTFAASYCADGVHSWKEKQTKNHFGGNDGWDLHVLNRKKKFVAAGSFESETNSKFTRQGLVALLNEAFVKHSCAGVVRLIRLHAVPSLGRAQNCFPRSMFQFGLQKPLPLRLPLSLAKTCGLTQLKMPVIDPQQISTLRSHALFLWINWFPNFYLFIFPVQTCPKSYLETYFHSCKSCSDEHRYATVNLTWTSELCNNTDMTECYVWERKKKKRKKNLHLIRK